MIDDKLMKGMLPEYLWPENLARTEHMLGIKRDWPDVSRPTFVGWPPRRRASPLHIDVYVTTARGAV